MTRQLLFALGVSLCGLACEPTTYGRAVQQQKREEDAVAEQRSQAQASAPKCPTLAAPGSRDYAECEAQLRESGVGGSGADGCVTR